MLDNTNWSDIIVGGLFGAVISPVLYLFIRALWLRMPYSLRRKTNYFYRKTLLSKNPFWIETDVSKGMKNIISYSESRIFIVRIGNLHMNNKIYSERINHMIEADHIWDWHFFLKNELASQNTNGWIGDFYHLNSKGEATTIVEDNSTTELGLIKRSRFRENTGIKEIFTEYELDTNFDDLIIYGVLKGVNSFPEISDLFSNHMDKLQVEKITLFYNDGEFTKEITYEAKRMATALIDCIIHIYNSDIKLYIDQEITDSGRESGLLLLKEIAG